MAVMTGDGVLSALPRQRQPVVSVRSDPLTCPLSLMVLQPPARPAPSDTAPLSRLLPIQRDRRWQQRGPVRGLLALAIAAGFAAALWTLIAGSAVALGRAL